MVLAAVELDASSVGSASPLAGEWEAEELYPGPGVTSKRDISNYVRRTAITYHHQVGTCKMGVDVEAVVDPKLRRARRAGPARRRRVGDAGGHDRQHARPDGDDRGARGAIRGRGDVPGVGSRGRSRLSGGSNALTGGSGPRSARSLRGRAVRSTLAPAATCRRRAVSTLGLPCTHIAISGSGSRGRTTRPVESCTTPGAHVVEHHAGQAAPAVVEDAHDSPSAIPRLAASSG